VVAGLRTQHSGTRNRTTTVAAASTAERGWKMQGPLHPFPTWAHPLPLQSAFISPKTPPSMLGDFPTKPDSLGKFMMSECGFSWAFSANTWPYARLLPDTYVQQKSQVVLKFNETRSREIERERERDQSSGTPLGNQIFRPTCKPNLFMYKLCVCASLCVCVCVSCRVHLCCSCVLCLSEPAIISFPCT